MNVDTDKDMELANKDALKVENVDEEDDKVSQYQ